MYEQLQLFNTLICAIRGYGTDMNDLFCWSDDAKYLYIASGRQLNKVSELKYLICTLECCVCWLFYAVAVLCIWMYFYT